MDPAAELQHLSPDGGAVKRSIENSEDEQLTKRRRRGPADLKRVAEIVLVLSTMAAMRGARSPTPAELGLMEEARVKLAEMFQSFSPKEIVAREAVEAVIEDLGLNWKDRDQKLGFRGSRLSISEKVEVTARKMEDSKKFAAPSVTYNSHPLQTSIGAATESYGTPNNVRTFPSDKPSQAPISSGGFPVSSPLGHVSASTSTSIPYQLSNSDVRASTISSGLPGGYIGRDSSSLAVPRVELQLQANSSANHPLVNAPTWSIQPQSISSAKTGPENKVNSGKVEGTANASMSQMVPQAARDQSFRPFITQTASGNLPSMHQPLQGTDPVQVPRPVYNHHSEIAKIVQNLIQPQLPELPTWTPPSRDYMSKPLTCQECKLAINEVESVLLCDACEKGYHLKCLQSYNQKGIPRGEWHCIKCLTLSAGKPLPPKYGRVMRNVNAPKLPLNASGVQSSSEKKVGTSDPKGNQLKITIGYKSDHLHPADNPQDVERTGLPNSAEVPSKLDNSHMVKDSEKLHIRENPDCTSRYDSKRDDQNVAQENPARSSVISIGAERLAGFSSDHLHDVKWIGDVLKIVDGKKFYESCCINGVTYTVKDHAFFHSSHDKLIPSKLQAMLEDSNTGSKWVIVNRCYFPGDLPQVVNRPSTPENNEVYGSNHDSTIMAGLIQGACEVLPPAKFKEESERRSQLGTEANSGLQPVFLCKWFYDEFNGLFQPVSS